MMNDDFTQLERRAHEAFIRRASKLNDANFMLKGSYVSRQYFDDPSLRIPADLDWVYIGAVTDPLKVVEELNNWAGMVTDTHLDDGVKFKSFSENEFWRRIDYAMADDFPTVNTDLVAYIDDKKVDFGLDISFNLDIEFPPIPLEYKLNGGNNFTVPSTVPLSLQVSWKIHQTVVRPRLKDLFDLIHLVQHPNFNEDCLKDCLQALVNECAVDNVPSAQIEHFFTFRIHELYTDDGLEANWRFWRHSEYKSYSDNIFFGDQAKRITDEEQLPTSVEEFLALFSSTMKEAGFGPHTLEMLPAPTRKVRLQSKMQAEVHVNDTAVDDLSNEIPKENSVKPIDKHSTIFDSIRKFFKKNHD